MTVIILAGGKSERMGRRDKAFLKIGRDSIVARQLRLIKKHFTKIIIVTNSMAKYKGLKGVRVIPDIIPDRGSLGGILSGLLASEDRYNFVIACDMPFINTRLMKYMYENSAGYDVVVPKVDGRYEPLFSLYSKDCVRYIEPLIEKKRFKISGFFSRIKVKSISRKEVERFGEPDVIFMNVNTPDDLLKING